MCFVFAAHEVDRALSTAYWKHYYLDHYAAAAAAEADSSLTSVSCVVSDGALWKHWMEGCNKLSRTGGYICRQRRYGVALHSSYSTGDARLTLASGMCNMSSAASFFKIYVWYWEVLSLLCLVPSSSIGNVWTRHHLCCPSAGISIYVVIDWPVCV